MSALYQCLGFDKVNTNAFWNQTEHFQRNNEETKQRLFDRAKIR